MLKPLKHLKGFLMDSIIILLPHYIWISVCMCVCVYFAWSADLSETWRHLGKLQCLFVGVSKQFNAVSVNHKAMNKRREEEESVCLGVSRCVPWLWSFKVGEPDGEQIDRHGHTNRQHVLLLSFSLLVCWALIRFICVFVSGHTVRADACTRVAERLCVYKRLPVMRISEGAD